MEHRLVGADMMSRSKYNLGPLLDCSSEQREWKAAAVWQRLARCWVLKARAEALTFGIGMPGQVTGRPGPAPTRGRTARHTCWTSSHRARLARMPRRRHITWGTARMLRTTQWTRASLLYVAKLLRAHGGCLGTRNRRRT